MSEKEQFNIGLHLHEFACLGLRTLVMAQKDLKQYEFDEWYKMYSDLLVSNNHDKETLLNSLYDDME